ncbi:TetR/AcrR family transcriptional regulator [Brachybacterium hainanense]|uniref:TetR/AcrR family transcriptional regulator n=1 Tax=Brachybacterium hainanense TaxID=1541174 RepID=A0ABV6R8P0_9MICO
MRQEAQGEASRLVAMAWGVAAAPQRGPRRELSHERIVEAATAIADAEGLGAVTMQRVARAFGFTTMALYRYVSSKDDLHQLMLDAVVGEEWAIEDGDWRIGLEQWARTIAAGYARHPWALDLPLSQETLLMPGQLRAVDQGMRALRTLPASPEAKLGVLMAVSVQVRGFAGLSRDVAAEEGGVDEPTRRLLREIVAQGRFPDARAVIESDVFFGDSGAEAGEDDDLGVALQILMPGIAAVFGEDGTEPTPPAPDDDPDARLTAAQEELAAVTALRKATQRRVRELEKREERARRLRDDARAAAKAAARRAARAGDGLGS